MPEVKSTNCGRTTRISASTSPSSSVSHWKARWLKQPCPDLLENGINMELREMLMHSEPPAADMEYHAFAAYSPETGKPTQVLSVPWPAAETTVRPVREQPCKYRQPCPVSCIPAPVPTSATTPLPAGEPMDLSSYRRGTTRRERGVLKAPGRQPDETVGLSFLRASAFSNRFPIMLWKRQTLIVLSYSVSIFSRRSGEAFSRGSSLCHLPDYDAVESVCCIPSPPPSINCRVV